MLYKYVKICMYLIYYKYLWTTDNMVKNNKGLCYNKNIFFQMFYSFIFYAVG